MKPSGRIANIGLAVALALVVAACGPGAGTSTGGGSTTSAATAKSADDLGGMNALVTAAKNEGTLNVIALPPDWANYGAIISAFSAKYGIQINSANPNGSSQDEVNAVVQLNGTTRAPDVLDIGMAVAYANVTLFAPYKVASWSSIPASQKDPKGLWFQDYGGYMSIGYDSAKLPRISSLPDLLQPAFKGKVALNGDPTKANAALNGVMMASLASGGSAGNIGPGVDFFQKLHQAGNFVPIQATTATVKNGTTPVVFDWDYLSAAHGTDVPTWKVFVPSKALLGGYYAQAINKQAPHPAAARLWEEFLYTAQGQNLWLKGLARPVEMSAMQTAGTIDKTAAAALPPVSGKPTILTEAQATAASQYVQAHWASAIT
jgi:putative spermidine/putrescine transport system substrate-binding protein